MIAGSTSGGAGSGVQASPLPLQRLQLEESLNGGGGGGAPVSPRAMLRWLRVNLLLLTT